MVYIHPIFLISFPGIKDGVVKPLPRTVFSETEVEDAFRYFSSGKHMGKVLIQIREEQTAILKSPARTILAERRVYFHPKKAYIIIGGLGGVGLELTDWMIRRGAKKFILNSRSGVKNGYQEMCLKKWRQLGIAVDISSDNSAKAGGAERLISAAHKLGPVGGKSFYMNFENLYTFTGKSEAFSGYIFNSQ